MLFQNISSHLKYLNQVGSTRIQLALANFFAISCLWLKPQICGKFQLLVPFREETSNGNCSKCPSMIHFLPLISLTFAFSIIVVSTGMSSKNSSDSLAVTPLLLGNKGKPQ
ncbi:hypothetical protein B6A09_0065 [Saccharomyces cerevisiae synthetic construct]|uniref:Putative uncharacterized protein YBL094C n=2 Tax=Saccharomyces cerevisiae TaxID=4932 RepID=YBJ4_YEAST|nr:RecName: Full=Putative uncharacterized protein YBL094C [Saccharomyces cerevisiae S288C]ARB01688.1 hypothetical protein B6A09_0065 [Saccharomyces cerevisiae synthetic construct]KZV12972.1 hypothetical protein WN66_00149 [Saccharomyces cerevisiae]CAY77689.1 EC1118_1B15_0155p [Saccharomyces cerevisiae EC1118]WNV71787.1 hypothetical protein O6U65_0013 [Saccharomyces cerevisiae synthetic construct]CAA56008.1 E-110 protein [Saccharomyces cerevisiae]